MAGDYGAYFLRPAGAGVADPERGADTLGRAGADQAGQVVVAVGDAHAGNLADSAGLGDAGDFARAVFLGGSFAGLARNPRVYASLSSTLTRPQTNSSKENLRVQGIQGICHARQRGGP